MMISSWQSVNQLPSKSENFEVVCPCFCNTLRFDICVDFVGSAGQGSNENVQRRLHNGKVNTDLLQG